jgi:cell division initiation protein
MKKFSTSLTGYNKEEVNKFVDDVTNNYEAMLNRLKKTDEELASVKNTLAKYQSMENTLNRAMLIAEETNAQMKRVAKDESESLVNDAKKNASRIINDALIKAEKAQADADALKRRVEIYKYRIKQVIDEQREMIDDIDKIDY